MANASFYPWDKFIHYFRGQWRQGQHITIIGPTGSGKSYLSLQIIGVRKHYVLLLSKGVDDTLDKFIRKNDIEIITEWPPSGFAEKVALWPRFRNVDSFAHQQTVFRNAINGYKTRTGKQIDGIYTEGSWAVYLDEVIYFTEDLNLELYLRMLWTQGRSNGISVVASAQRPRDVPQLMLNQWQHLFLFQTSDKYELQRLADIGGNISSIIKDEVPRLREFEFLYINRRTNEAFRSKAR